MYLKQLQLQGFKSFADKTVLEFMPGITTVIGPNGSGKSNIADAIRWVLGEQSMKSLRGAKSEDIIFAGTQNRKSLGFAEASLSFDNSDHKLPIEYAEVVVTRRIYRSGESGYFINKVPCRLKDIVELFMDTGIGKDGYSIIGQGKIDEILSNKSEDRRHIFEEAAGIVKYRSRKEESEKKLEHTKLNLLRIHDILAQIEGSIEPLKAQSEKAKKFLSLREELKGMEIGLFLQQIDSNKEKLEQVKQDRQIIEATYTEKEEEAEKVKQEKEQVKKQVDSLIIEVERLQNLGFESSNQIEKLTSQISVAKERITGNDENKQRYQTEIEELKQRIVLLKEEQENKVSKRDMLMQNKEKFEKELEEKKQELQKLSQTLSDKEKQIEQKKQQVEQAIDKKYEVQNSINSKDILYENLEKREKTVKNEISTTISELDEARMNKNEVEQSFLPLETKRNSLIKQLEEQKIKQEESSKKIKSYNEQLVQMEYNLRMKDSRLKFLQETEKEKEGYNKTVKSLLVDCEKIQELGKGMHGVLANILSVEKEYETAIEMCLGAGLQNIVTESEQEAKKLIEYLRQNHLGRASFLPISSVKGRKLEKWDQKGIQGVIGLASDLVQYDKKYEGIVQNLLGKTVIVENIDTGVALAKKNHYGFRIVTKQGDVLNASGAMTGGSVSTKTVNILGRGREIEELQQQIKTQTKQFEQKKQEMEQYKQSIQSILKQVEEYEKQLQGQEIIYATEKQKVLSMEEMIEKLEIRLEKLKKELENLQEGKVKAVQEKEEKQIEIQDLTKQIEKNNQEIEEFAKSNQDKQSYIDDLNMDITNLKISVSSFEESENSIQELSERIDKEIQTNQNGIQNKQQQIETMKKEKEQLEQTIQVVYEEIAQIKKEVQDSGIKVEQLKQEREQKNIQFTKLEEQVTKGFEMLQEIKGQIIKIEVKEVKLAEEIEEIVNKMWEEYEITPNHAQEYSKPQNVMQTQKKVNQLRTQIRGLGSVNIDSIEEYKQTKERYDFMCEQRLDLENAIEKLRKIIQEMTLTMKEQFAEKFEQINTHFNEVFQELFGGGKAQLILEDESNLLECGIDIHVQPPGKKLQNMTLLSGGEKAFTAIAILFAILKINPAPFCVLDEIEAALDDVNVYRYADYLKKFAKQTQFLVITHRKGTMEAADTVYGITMEENGISKLLSMKLH